MVRPKKEDCPVPLLPTKLQVLFQYPLNFLILSQIFHASRPDRNLVEISKDIDEPEKEELPACLSMQVSLEEKGNSLARVRLTGVLLLLLSPSHGVLSD